MTFSLYAQNPNSKLIFIYCSVARYVSFGGPNIGVPIAGMDRMAAVAHNNNIPATWFVCGQAAKEKKADLDLWHSTYGDNIAIAGHSDVDNIKKYLPWGRFDLGADYHMLTTPQGIPDANVRQINTLEKYGYKCLWGFCWEQKVVDNLSDKGCPWGFFYSSTDSAATYKNPSPSLGDFVGVEWVSRDLTSSYFLEAPCVFSFDPNDVLRAGLCTADDITYWEKAFDEYLRNVNSNDYIFMVVQQESHEMDPNFNIYNKSDQAAAATMLDKLVKYAKGKGATFMTLGDAIDLYRKTYTQTNPQYMLCNSPEAPLLAFKSAATDRYRKTYINTKAPLSTLKIKPFFHYYDQQTMLQFEEGSRTPRRIMNYTEQQQAPINKVLPAETTVPAITSFVKKGNDWTINVTTTKSIPYGIAEWGDFANLEIVATTAKTAKIIDNKLVFIRADLVSGATNTISVTLRNKNSSREALSITNPKIDCHATQARISWNTDEVSESEVEYGLTATYGSKSRLNDNTQNHCIWLNHLIPGTRYHFRIKTLSSSGTVGLSSDYSFKTLDADTNIALKKSVTTSSL